MIADMSIYAEFDSVATKYATKLVKAAKRLNRARAIHEHKRHAFCMSTNPGDDTYRQYYRAHLAVKRAEKHAGNCLNELLYWEPNLTRAAALVAWVSQQEGR